MKAKDYAKQFNDNPTKETLTSIGLAFDKETSELVKSRNVKTDTAFLSTLGYHSHITTALFLLNSLQHNPDHT